MSLNVSDCINHYCYQVGSGKTYFQGIPIQRGYGIFGDIFRRFSPYIVKAGKYFGKKLLHTGSKIINDVTAGKSIRESAKDRLLETGRTIGDDVIKNLQSGSGIKRKRDHTENHSSRKKPNFPEGFRTSRKIKNKIISEVKNSPRKKQKKSTKHCGQKDIFS